MPRLLCILLLALVFALPLQAADLEWDIEVGIDDSIFPSLIIATSTLLDDDDDPDPTILGDPWGFVGVSIVAPADRTPVRVEISSGKLISPSVWEGLLPKKGETYLINPVLKFDYDALLAVHQPFPEVVTARVALNGQPHTEKSKRVPVRTINDCILGFEDEEGDFVDTSWLFAAYVNENHPVVDELLGEALKAGYVDSFAGYQKDADDVAEEIEAVYRAIQDRGFRYSNITRSSGASGTVSMQHVRLIGQQVRTAQANCVEGSALFASVFRKLEMNPFLVAVPGHMFVCVHLDEEQEDTLCIETTMVGSASFAKAVSAGNDQFLEALPFFISDSMNEEASEGYAIIDIEDARQSGIMPISEAL